MAGTPESPTDQEGATRLSTQDDWKETWEDARMGPLEFPFRVPAFADLDDLFRRHLPCDPTYRCLELGCCPGQYLWYFHNRFGYHPSGLDYLEDGCRETQARCAANELEADIIHADLFDFECNDEYPPWDVIASFGLVEHFEDIMPCLHRHIDLVRPGGYVAIVIPNHAGLNGTILRLHMPDRYRLHNLMSWADLREGLEATNRVEIIEGGHYGRIGFWNTAVYRRARKYGKIPYAAIRAPLWAIEHAGRILPNSSYFSPNIAVIARRTD